MKSSTKSAGISLRSSHGTQVFSGSATLSAFEKGAASGGFAVVTELGISVLSWGYP
jgi:hypothetical protein